MNQDGGELDNEESVEATEVEGERRDGDGDGDGDIRGSAVQRRCSSPIVQCPVLIVVSSQGREAMNRESEEEWMRVRTTKTIKK